MPKIYTTESIIERFKLKNRHDFDYSKVDYNGMSIPVTVICPIHNDIMLTPSQLLRNVGCPKCTNNKLTQLKTNKENFIKESNEVHQNKYDYSKVDYKGVTTKVKIICPVHGEFWQTPRVHLKGCGCPKCGLERQNDATRLTTEEFIIRANKIQGNKYDYSKVEYVDYMTKVCIICPEHGEFWQTPNKHLLGQGCPKCGNTKKLTLTEFIERSRKIHADKYDYSKVRYINNGTKVCIICPDHGEFWQTPHNHLKYGCSKCQSSKLEKEVREILDEYNIAYEEQKTFDWLVYKQKMYLDFYLPKYNIGIECQGEQHFNKYRFEKDEKRLILRQKRDKIKKFLCEEFYNMKVLYYGNHENLINNKKKLIETIYENHKI